MLKADTKYNGRVGEGAGLHESGTGTMGFRVPLEYDDGNTEFIIWLSDKAKEKAQKTFTEVLGIPLEKLQSSTYFEYQLGQDIVGREVSFGTKEEEYKGKRKVKVAWIDKKSASLGVGVAAAAAQFFGGKAPMAPISDDDIPF